MKTTVYTILLIFSLSATHVSAGKIVVIGNSNVPAMDPATIQKIYTGKIITYGGVNVNPIAFKTGAPERVRFLQSFLKQDEDKYTAYWTVRRYIGKGVPPAELSRTEDIIRYVTTTPGAIGYIDEDELKPGLKVVSR